MVYEAMLLFGVVAVTGALFSVLFQQRHALYLRHALQIWLLFVITCYFIWFWTHGGQTLAMKTWRIRLVTAKGGQVDVKRAFFRYLISWLWILPGLALAWLVDARNWALAIVPAANILLWAVTIYLDPNRQFLHDRLAGTRVINTPS